MSILIKGMEMPTSCGECDLCACYVFEDGTEEYYRCPITMYPIRNFDERHDGCPLIPVPPHGDLIDRDALPWENQGLMLTDPDEWGLKVWDIEHAPTIILAEEGE